MTVLQKWPLCRNYQNVKNAVFQQFIRKIWKKWIFVDFTDCHLPCTQFEMTTCIFTILSTNRYEQFYKQIQLICWYIGPPFPFLITKMERVPCQYYSSAQDYLILDSKAFPEQIFCPIQGPIAISFSMLFICCTRQPSKTKASCFILFFKSSILSISPFCVPPLRVKPEL